MRRCLVCVCWKMQAQERLGEYVDVGELCKEVGVRRGWADDGVSRTRLNRALVTDLITDRAFPDCDQQWCGLEPGFLSLPPAHDRY